MTLRQRIAAAAKALFVRSFDAAGGGQRWPAWASMASPVRTQLAARQQLAARSSYLMNNSPSAAAIADVWTSSLVGDGPSVRSGHPSEAVRTALEDAWGRFYDQADQEGVADLAGMLSGLTRSMVTAGEGLMHLVASPRGELRLRLLSPEQLDPAMTREVADMAHIIAGVEFSADGRRLAYHVYPTQPDLVAALATPVRVPAEDIVHAFDQKTPGQVRGISWLAPVLTRLQQLDRLEDALLARANTAALFGAFVTDPEGTSGLGSGKVDPQELSLEPGVLRILPPSATVTFPSMPSNEDMPDILRHIVRQVATGVGLPYELLASDLSEATYSSAKLGLEAHRRRVDAIRALILDARVLQPIWRRFVTLEVLSGRLYAPDFERDPEPYFSMVARWPAFSALDPYREAQADAALLAAGIRSRAEIIASRGRDVTDVDAEIAADTFVPRAPARANLTLVGDMNA
jgi:lambda family phage portal protein